jgi:hypothetical protein
MTAAGPVRGVITPRWMVPAVGSKPGAAARALAPAVVAEVLFVLELPPQATKKRAATPTKAVGKRNLRLLMLSPVC